jgi:copper transport protein
MTSTRMGATRTGRMVRRSLAMSALALLLVGVWGTPAFAHAVLQGTVPGAGATVQRSPNAVTLTFNEHVEASLGAIRAFDSRAQRIDTGSPKHPGGDASKVSVSLPKLSDGTYVVTWRVISADSHPVRGAFTFTVGTSATTAKQAQGLAARLLTDEGGSATVGVLFAIMRFGAFAGMAILIGAVAFLAYVWRSGRGQRRARILVWSAWGTALGCTLLGFGLQGPYAAALDVNKVIDPNLWSDVWGTRFGHVYLGRVLLLLVAIPLLRMLLPRRGPVVEHPLPKWWIGVTAVMGVALAASPGLAGHASTGPLVPLAQISDTLHVFGVGIWLGGLVMLFAALMPLADEATLRDVVPRYSQFALVSMGVIVVTGTFQAFRQIDRVSAILDTDYGRLLLIKVSVFLALMVVAAVSRDIVNRRWRIPAEELPVLVPVGAGVGAGVGASSSAGGASSSAMSGSVLTDAPPEAPNPPPAPRTPIEGDGWMTEVDLIAGDGEYPEGYVLDEGTAERRLRRSLLLEVLISIVILAVTALLVNAAPARDLDTGPFLATLNTKSISFDITITPGNRGANEMHLFTLTRSGATADPADVSAEMSQSDKGIAPIKVDLIRLGPGHYTSAGFTVPFAGDWKLTTKAVVNNVDEVLASTTVPIH